MRLLLHRDPPGLLRRGPYRGVRLPLCPQQTGAQQKEQALRVALTVRAQIVVGPVQVRRRPLHVSSGEPHLTEKRVPGGDARAHGMTQLRLDEPLGLFHGLGGVGGVGDRSRPAPRQPLVRAQEHVGEIGVDSEAAIGRVQSHDRIPQQRRDPRGHGRPYRDCVPVVAGMFSNRPRSASPSATRPCSTVVSACIPVMRSWRSYWTGFSSLLTQSARRVCSDRLRYRKASPMLPMSHWWIPHA